MIEQTNADGRWTSDDNGGSWQLVEPSPEWEARKAAQATDPQASLWLDEAPPVAEEPPPE